MKACFKCGEVKPLAAFYRHPMMADGYLNKCKDCAKRDVRIHRTKHPEALSAYEHRRNKTSERRQQKNRNTRLYRIRHPERVKAHCAVSKAIRDGRLERGPCEICGTRIDVQAHHDDYGLPLNVRWLCFRHHRENAHNQVVVSPGSNLPAMRP